MLYSGYIMARPLYPRV